MPADTVLTQEASGQQHVARLMDGFLVTQLLYVAARLGVADALADGPRTVEELAAATGARPDPLRRVLRGLAAEGIVDEHAAGRFGLTAAGDCLRRDAPGSLRGAIAARGDLYYRTAPALVDVVTDGGVAFERVHGAPFFEYLTANPERRAEFQSSMLDRSRHEAAAVVAAYNFARFGHVVDVGGGPGVVLEAILTASPDLHGTLFDLPAVAERTRERLAATPVADKVEVVGGDFFQALPVRSGAYLLSRVIHDWNDAEAVRILTSCRGAMEEGDTLLLVEAVLPERAQEQPAAIRMDLLMLLLLGGRERTATELGELLAVASFTLDRVIPTDSPSGICIVEATRLPSAPGT